MWPLTMFTEKLTERTKKSISYKKDSEIVSRVSNVTSV